MCEIIVELPAVAVETEGNPTGGTKEPGDGCAEGLPLGAGFAGTVAGDGKELGALTVALVVGVA